MEPYEIFDTTRARLERRIARGLKGVWYAGLYLVNAERFGGRKYGYRVTD